MAQKEKYDIIYAQVYERHNGKRELSSWRVVDLKFDSAEDCRKVLELAHLIDGAWEIRHDPDGSRPKVVERSPVMAELQEQAKQESEAYHQEQRAKVAEINELPAQLVIDYGQVQVIISKGEASYNPAMSRNMRCPINMNLKCGEEQWAFQPSAYVTGAGAVQKKKFLADLERFFQRISTYRPRWSDDRTLVEKTLKPVLKDLPLLEGIYQGNIVKVFSEGLSSATRL